MTINLITEYICGGQLITDNCSLHGCTGERVRAWIFGRPPLHKGTKIKAQLCPRGIATITAQGCLVRIDTPKDDRPTEEELPFLDESALEEHKDDE